MPDVLQGLSSSDTQRRSQAHGRVVLCLVLVQCRELLVLLHEAQASVLPKLDAFMWSCECFEIHLSVQGCS